MNKSSIDISKLSIEQRVVLHLARKGFLTAGGDIQRALVDQEYAERLVLGINGGIPECDHDILSNEQIKEVFTNDYDN